jgi:hypothetical protein
MLRWDCHYESDVSAVSLLVLASCTAVRSVVLGSGTTLLAAKKLERNFIGIDASAKYKRLFERRCKDNFGEQQQQQPPPPQPSQLEQASSSRITQQSSKRQKLQRSRLSILSLLDRGMCHAVTL